MSSILKGLNEGRNYGRDSWDSNMPGYQGDYGGAENFGRRNREWDEDDRIDARIRAEYEKKKEYEQNGKFWLKFKDSQRHLPAGPFIGKQAANTAALELLKQQPELKGNLLITAYGPDETQGVSEADKHYSNTKNPVDFPKTWHDVDKKLGKAVDKMSQAEKVKKGFAHPDTLKKKGVAEGQLDELSNKTLASYKKKAGADATQADKRGDYARGDKRMSGIIKATKKEFDNDAKGVTEAGNKPIDRQFPLGTGDTRTPRDIKSQMRDASDKFVQQTAASKTGPLHSRVAKMQNKMAKSELRKRDDHDRLATGTNEEMSEEKQRLDPSCWKGYKKQGTKMKGDTRVNNCVPVKKESAIMKGLVDEDRQGDK